MFVFFRGVDMNRIFRLTPHRAAARTDLCLSRPLLNQTSHRINRMAPMRLSTHSSRPLSPENRRFDRGRKIGRMRQRVIRPLGSPMVKKTVRQRARELRISIFSYPGEVDLCDFRALVVRLNETNYNKAFNALF